MVPTNNHDGFKRIIFKKGPNVKVVMMVPTCNPFYLSIFTNFFSLSPNKTVHAEKLQTLILCQEKI